MPLKNRLLLVIWMALAAPLANADPNLVVTGLEMRRDAATHGCGAAPATDGTVVTNGTDLNGNEPLDMCVTYGNTGPDSTGVTYQLAHYLDQPTAPDPPTAGVQSTLGPTGAGATSTERTGVIAPDGTVCWSNCRSAVYIDWDGMIAESNETNNFLASVPRYNVPVYAASVAPNQGSGLTQTFVATYARHKTSPTPARSSGITEVWLGFTPDGTTAIPSIPLAAATPTLPIPNSCVVRWQQATGVINLLNDAGDTWSASLTNSRCTVSLGGVTFAPSNPNFTLTVTVTLQQGTLDAYAGVKKVYLYVTDGILFNHPVIRGTWVVPVSSANLPHQCLLPIPYQNQSVLPEKSS